MHNLCGCCPLFLGYFTSLSFSSLLRFFLWVVRCPPLLQSSLSVNTLISILDTCLLLRHEDKQSEISQLILSTMISQSERAKPCLCYLTQQKARAEQKSASPKSDEKSPDSPLAQWSIDSSIDSDLDEDPLVNQLFGNSFYQAKQLSAPEDEVSLLSPSSQQGGPQGPRATIVSSTPVQPRLQVDPEAKSSASSPNSPTNNLSSLVPVCSALPSVLSSQSHFFGLNFLVSIPMF